MSPVGAAVLACVMLALAGCDSGGSELDVINESDQDVVVWVVADQPHSVRVPARSWGHVFSAWSRPERDIEVYDAACNLVASIPYDHSWLHIGSDGSVSSFEHRGPMPDGIAEAASFERAACR
jgi:hypothetical protein